MSHFVPLSQNWKIEILRPKKDMKNKTSWTDCLDLYFHLVESQLNKTPVQFRQESRTTLGTVPTFLSKSSVQTSRTTFGLARFGEKTRDNSQCSFGIGSMFIVDATSFNSMFSESHQGACSCWRRTEGRLHLKKYFWASLVLYRSPRDSWECHPNVFKVLQICTALLRVEQDEISPVKPRHRHLERQSWTGRLVKPAKLDLETQ